MSFNRVEIRQLVEEILAKNNIVEPTIDVEHIAEYAGLDVNHAKLEDELSGFLVVHRKQGTIAVNSAHHPNRQRFTIAHELGHYFLHSRNDQDENVFIDKKVFHRGKAASEGTIRMEIEANRFAAELLMPRFMMKTAVADEGGDIDLEDIETIENLAERFGVSTQALTYRLTDLNMLPRLWD